LNIFEVGSWPLWKIFHIGQQRSVYQTLVDDCHDRHLIENAFCRLKDFRQIATRYDKVSRNFLCVAAFIAFWLCAFHRSYSDGIPPCRRCDD
ncbi:MAG: hypothetical protein ACR2RL_03145, partial [Gammaproteobacteria bacterium]